MSTLAFNKEGEPFSFDDRTRQLRLRRFRKPGARGTCEAVLDADGDQVYIDDDSDYAELRHAVDNVPGFYRLDQCDEDGRPIADLPAAYVSVEAVRNAGSSSDADAMAVVRDLAAINAEVAKTMADRFAAVMQSTAEILRAADGAGIAHRKPVAVIAKVEDDDDRDDDDDDDVAPEPAPPSALESIATIVQAVQPMLDTLMTLYAQLKANAAPSAAHATPPAAATAPGSEPASTPPSAAAASSGSVPDGAAAGSSGTATATDTATEAHTPRAEAPPSTGAVASSPDAASTAAQGTTADTMAPTPANSSGTAAAAMPHGAPTTADASASSASSATKPTGAMRPTDTERSFASPAAATPPRVTERSGPGTGPASIASASAPGATTVRNAPLAPTMQQIAHLTAIRARLTPKEAAIAERVMARMTQDMLAQWLVDLSAQSVDQAVKTIRDTIASVEHAQRDAPRDGKRG